MLAACGAGGRLPASAHRPCHSGNCHRYFYSDLFWREAPDRWACRWFLFGRKHPGGPPRGPQRAGDRAACGGASTAPRGPSWRPFAAQVPTEGDP